MDFVKIKKKIKLALKYPKNTIQFIFKRDPYVRTDFPELITLFVTSACNLRCPMCENSTYRNEIVADQMMKYEEVEKLLPEFKKYQPFVYLVGGEPLINPDTFKIIKLLSSNGIFTSMTSNGLLLNKYAKEIAESGLEFLSLSLDHYEKDKHDAGRGVEGVYDNLIEGLRMLKIEAARTGTPSNFKINTVIRKDNIADLSKMYDFVESLGIDAWQLSHFAFKNPEAKAAIDKFKAETGLGDNALGLEIETRTYLSDAEIEKLSEQLAEIKEKGKRYRTVASVLTSVDDLRKYYQGEAPDKKSKCAAPFNSIQVHSGCRVKSGCLDTEIGNYANGDSLMNIWNSERNLQFQKLVRDEKVLPPCFRCHALTYIWHDNK